MITKKVATILLLALVLLASVMVLNPILAETTDQQKQKAETLLGILENSNTSITLEFSRFDAQNISVPQSAETVYAEGVMHAQQASSFMNQKQFSEACVEAVEATQKFEETLQLLQAVSPVEPTQTQLTAEAAISLKANITRAVQYLERLENLTAKASAAGYNTAAVQKRIEEVKLHLRNATQKLRALHLEAASEEFYIAKTLLDDLKQLFVRLTNLVTTSNTEQYLQEAEVRVSAARENITSSATLTPEAKEDAINALNNSEVSLANAKDRIADSNVDDAIDDLEEAKKWEVESDRAISSVADNSTSVAPTDESATRPTSVTGN